MGNCKQGVSVKVNEELLSVTPETVEEFFNKHVKEN